MGETPPAVGSLQNGRVEDMFDAELCSSVLAVNDNGRLDFVVDCVFCFKLQLESRVPPHLALHAGPAAET